jgi:hypothetical protein
MAIVGEAHIVVRAITSGFKNDVEKALKEVKPVTKKIGEDVGKEFQKSVSKGIGSGGKSPFSKIEKEADAARRTFNRLIKTGYLLGPAISGAVSAVGDLVLGLFAVGSAVGAAAPALAVLPGLLTAIAQGALTAKLAFGGVAKGIGALLKQKTGAGAGGSTNDNAIADARRRLAQVYQRSAETIAAANDKVRKAQEKLNDAFKEGTESLQQLGFDSEEAALAQANAAIELERAQETLARASGAGFNSRAYREAELALKQADLDYRKATDTVNDLAVQQEYAAQTGVEGTKEVIDATNDLAEAEADRAKAQRDSAQDILEAQIALQRALDRTNESSASSVDLLKDLSLEARNFAIYIADLKPEFLKLRAAAGEKLFGPLIVAIDMLVMRLFPVLKPMLTEMGGVVGNIARDFAEMLTRVDNLDIIERVFGGANIQIMRNLGDAFVDIAEGALNVLDAVAPLTVEFSEYIKRVADAWVGTMRFKNATGELTTSFERAAEFAKGIGGLLSSAFGAFRSLGSGASDAGLKIIDAFAGAFDKLKAFADEGNRTGTLSEKFDAIADNVIAIGGFLGEVAKMFYQISGNEGVKAFFDAIKPIPGIFADIFNKMTSTGPVFGEFLVNIALLIKAFTETGGIQLFFDILNKAASVLVAVFSNEIVQKVFLFLAAVKGVTLAFGVLYSVSRFAFMAIIGNLLVLFGSSIKAAFATDTLTKSILIKQRAMNIAASSSAFYSTVLGQKILAIKKATVAFRMLTVATIAATWPVLAVVAAVALVVGAFYMMYKNSEDLRNAVSELGSALKGTLLEAWNTIKDALTRLMPVFGDVGGAFQFFGDLVAKYIKFMIPLWQGMIKVIAAVITGVIGLVQGFIGIIRTLGAIVVVVVGGVIGAFTGSQEVIDASKNVMVGAINSIINGLNSLISAFNLLSPKDIPFIPLMEGAKTATDKLTESTKPLTDSQEAAKRKMEETAASAANLNVEFGSLKDIQATVRTEIENTFDRVTEGARSLVDARDAAKVFKEETDKLTTTLKDGTLTQDQKTDSLYAYSASVLDSIKKNIELGGTQESTTKLMQDGRQAFLDGAAALGMGATEAQNLANKLGLTPSTIKKTFEVSGLGSLQELTQQLGYLETLANTATGREDMGGMGRKMEKIRAEINTKMTVSFGKRSGQDAGSALFVNVANAKAGGGPVRQGKTYLVGEKGPEFFKADNSGTIIPNNKLSAGGGSGVVFNIYPSQGMNEVELANMVSRKVAWNLRIGA